MDAFNGILYTSICILGWQYFRQWKLSSHWEESYWNERRGRTRVEREMKKLTEVQLNTTEGFFVQPIGTIESCYRQCVGTPRQGLLVPSSRARLVLSSNMSPESLDGLEEFSHVWLTFKFHLNTNTLKEARAFNGVVATLTNEDNRKQHRNKYTFTAKITPPMLKEKKGVLATRSPHRPNPIGVTLARIERVDKKTRSVLLSACDLVDGTPVLDMKPYVAVYDTVEPAEYHVAPWIDVTIGTRNTVRFSEAAVAAAHAIAPRLRQYKRDAPLFLRALQETLEADVRSKFQTKRRISDSRSGQTVDVPFDEATVQFMWREERQLEVLGVMLTASIEAPAQLLSINQEEHNENDNEDKDNDDADDTSNIDEKL